MNAVPALTPVTRPLALTVATPVLSEDQVNVAPGIAAPLMSTPVAARLTVAPTKMLLLAGATLTLATSAGGTPSPVMFYTYALTEGFGAAL